MSSVDMTSWISCLSAASDNHPDRRFGRSGFRCAGFYCIGRNYAAHAKEMGSDPTREPPFFFQKPTRRDSDRAARRDRRSSVSDADQELSLRGRAGRRARQGRPQHPVGTARSSCVFGYAVGLDMTRRDLQRAMGDEKKPWESARASTTRRRSGRCIRCRQIGHFTKGAIWLKVNGEIKQNADLDQMIWSRRRADQQAVARRSSCCRATSSTPARRRTSARWCKGDVMEVHIDGLPDLRDPHRLGEGRRCDVDRVDERV